MATSPPEAEPQLTGAKRNHDKVDEQVIPPPPPVEPAFTPAKGGGPPGDDGPIRTVFVSGIPPDAKDRELQNLLRFLHGYEGSILTRRNPAKPLVSQKKKESKGIRGLSKDPPPTA